MAFIWLICLVLVAVAFPARAQERLNVVASFSILGDFVRNVGGDRVNVTTLVGPNGDAHVYAPTPADAKKIADAKLVVRQRPRAGGLAAAAGASPRAARRPSSPRPPASRRASSAPDADPHAWQSVANAKVYVANIRDALAAADPAGAEAYRANAAAYLAKLDALDREVRAGGGANPGKPPQGDLDP